MTIIYAYKKGIHIIPEFNLEKLFVNYKGYLDYCVPIALPMVVDGFSFEINSMLIGSMKIKAQFNAHMILCNIASMLYSFPLGLSGAACTLISNAVG